MDTLPIRVIIVLIALESYLAGFQNDLIEHYSGRSEENQRLEGLILSILKLVANIAATLIFSKLRSWGRRGLLVRCTGFLVSFI